MTRQQIIHDLFTGKNFTDCIGKMEPQHLQDDLKQEVILIVCEMPEEKIIGLHSRNELEFFVARIIITQVRGNRTPFSKKYLQRNEELTSHEVADNDIDEHREFREMMEGVALGELKALEKTHWYEYGLIQLYMKHRSFRAIERETGISYVSVYKSIRKALVNIRCSVNQRIEYINANPLKDSTAHPIEYIKLNPLKR